MPARPLQISMAIPTALAGVIGSVILCAVLHGSTPAEDSFLTAEEQAWLEAHPAIRLMPTPDYPPTEFFDERGLYRGITADFMLLIEQRLGIDFKLVRPTLEERLLRVPDSIGTDVVPLSAATPSREEDWVFTTPYLRYPAAILATRTSSELTMDDLVGRRVAVAAGYAAGEYVESEYPGIELVSTPDTADALRRLSTGDCFAAISDIPVATWYLEQEGISNIVVVGQSGYIYEMGISVRKDWPVLHNVLEKALATITQDERDAIYRKWVHLSILAPQPSVAWKYFLGALGVALAAVATVTAWNRSLKHQIAERTHQLEREIGERERAHDRERMMMRELDHRVKNTLATVLAISGQTARGAPTLAEYTRTFAGRIGSLARIHERLSQRRWSGLRMRELVESTLQPYGPAARTNIDGEELILPPAAAMPLAMTMHELVTNAAKHGALAESTGAIDVTWGRAMRDGKTWAHVDWTERGGPPVTEPDDLGFGTSLIRGGVRYELGGEVALEFEPSGVRCRIDFPLEGHSPQPEPEPERASQRASGSGKMAPSVSGSRRSGAQTRKFV